LTLADVRRCWSPVEWRPRKFVMMKMAMN